MLSFVSRHRQSWSSLLCRLAPAGYSNKVTPAKVFLARRSVSINWLHISETHTKLRPHMRVHKKKCLEKGKFSEWKSISSIFFSTKCIVPIITEMQFLKVHTNKLCIEISMVSNSNLRSYSKKSIAVRLLAVNVILNFSKQEKQLQVFGYWKFIQNILNSRFNPAYNFFSPQTLIQYL